MRFLLKSCASGGSKMDNAAYKNTNILDGGRFLCVSKKKLKRIQLPFQIRTYLAVIVHNIKIRYAKQQILLRNHISTMA